METEKRRASVIDIASRRKPAPRQESKTNLFAFPVREKEVKMPKKLLVCTRCRIAIFLDSAVHEAPRWKGNLRDPDKIEEMDGQDDLRDFRETHQDKAHEVIEAELIHD